MKKSIAILGSLIVLCFFAAPVFAQNGPRHGMMYGGGPGYGPRWQGSEGLTKEQSSELFKLRQSFLDETAATRAELWAKKGQMYSLLSSSTPDEEKVMGLVDEMNKIKSDLNRKRVEYLLKARKVAPEAGSYGFGFGGHMMDWNGGGGPMMGWGGGHMGWGGGHMGWGGGPHAGGPMRGWDGCPGWGPYGGPEAPQE